MNLEKKDLSCRSGCRQGGREKAKWGQLWDRCIVYKEEGFDASGLVVGNSP